MTSGEAGKGKFLWVWLALIAAVLIWYSQTLALTWDEGFHLTAAQMINAGKMPYRDFLFAQTPVGAYWNAFAMRIFGQTWRTAHVLAAVESSVAVALAADYVLRRMPLGTALITAFSFGLNIVVVEFGTLSQAYGLALMLIVAAFRLAVASFEKGSAALALGAGVFAGLAAGSTLLTVTVAPVIFVWIAWTSRDWRRTGAFAAGVVLGLSPVIWLFAQAPQRFLFSVMKFHLFFRQVQWEGWQVHDLEVATAWLDCSQALILGVLALAGLFWIRKSGWAAELRSELYLAGWLMATMCVYLMTTHPTFQRYFLLAAPFAAILAAAGFEALKARIAVPASVVLLVLALGLGRSVYEDKDDDWSKIEPIAKKVDEVTAKGALLLADEHVYFLLNRLPPPGLEWNGAHKVELPPAQAKVEHLIPRSELLREVKAGRFDTVETCGSGEPAAMTLDAVYSQKAEINECFVYWAKRK
jgi:4-amino-4-deoxy-L-arabinose transferase-like glycosyltransferase